MRNITASSTRTPVGEPVDGGRGEAEGERRRRLLDEVTAAIEAQRPGFRAAENLAREELPDRCRGRAEATEG